MSTLSETLSTIRSLELAYFLYAVLLYFALTALYALRLQVILSKLGIRISFLDSFIANQLSVAVNNLTPSFRLLGEGVRAAYVYLRVKGRPVGVIAAMVFDKIVEVPPLIVLAIATLPESARAGGTAYSIVVIVAGVSGVTAAILYWDKIVGWVVEKARQRGYKISVTEVERQALRRLASDKLLVAVCTAISLAAWLVLALRLYLVGLSVGWRAEPYKFIVLTVLYTVVNLATPTPGGVGVIEASLAGLLAALGAPPDKALAASLVERFISYVIGTAAGIALSLPAGGLEIWRRLRSQSRGSKVK